MVYLCYPFYSVGFSVCFGPLPPCSPYYEFIIEFEVRYCDAFSIVLSTENCLVYSGSLCIHENSMFLFFKLVKNITGILTVIL